MTATPRRRDNSRRAGVGPKAPRWARTTRKSLVEKAMARNAGRHVHEDTDEAQPQQQSNHERLLYIAVLATGSMLIILTVIYLLRQR